MTTLAEYNNNPGNIRPAKGVKYEGLIGVDDKGFAIFEAPKYGQQALINDITYKLGKGGIKTPDEFVNMYSPKGDENSEESRDNYKIYIAQMLGLKSTNDPFPENSVDRLSKAIANFEGGTWQKKADDEQTTEDVADTAEPKEVPTGSAEVERNHWPEMLAGAGVGAKVAGSVESGRQAIPFVQNVLTRMAGNVPNPNAPATRPSLQRYLNSQISPNLRMPLTELEKVAGVDKIRTMSEVQNALKAIQEVKSERVAKTASVDPKTGTPRQIFTQTEARPAVDLSKFEHTPTLATRATDELARGAEFVRGALPSVARVGVGALGGALAGRQLYDAFDQYKKEGKGWNLHMPSARNASQIASGVGGALGTLPFGVTQAAGLALQAPEIIGQLNDADVAQNFQAVADYNRSMKNLPAQPTESEIDIYRQMEPARNTRLGIRR